MLDFNRLVGDCRSLTVREGYSVEAKVKRQK